MSDAAGTATASADAGQGTEGADAAAQQAAEAAAAAGQGAGDQGQGGERWTAPQVDTTGWPPAAIEALEKANEAARKQHTANHQLRQERGDERIAAKTRAAEEARAELLADLNKVLNPEAAGGEATVEGLTADVQRVGSERDGATRTAEAYRAALLALMPGDDATKADALEFLEFKLGRDTAYTQSDPTAEDFRAKIGASVGPLVAGDPRFKLSGTATASGVESLGGASGTDTITQERFDAMSMAERGALYNTDRATYDRLTGRSSS